MLRKQLPLIPEVYTVKPVNCPEIPMPMFANDEYGCCVIAARAHQTLRFEEYEQARILGITDSDVLEQYWKEGRVVSDEEKPDNGLVMLYSICEWRNNGWKADSCNYKINAFAELNPLFTSEIRYGIYAFRGLMAGLMLPISAQKQFNKGKDWAITTDDDESWAGSWGGHAVYVVGYTPDGLFCITWGQLQFMTWGFWYRYCDECYAVIDAANYDESILDVSALEDKLADLLVDEIMEE